MAEKELTGYWWLPEQPDDQLPGSTSLPDDLTTADTRATRFGVSRSALYATAVAEFLAKHSESEVTERLDQLYGTERSGLDPALRRAQQRSLSPESW